ncbi:MAG: hypothetical protein ACJ762_21010 [Solirubrobacteraceae bacterium]
MRSRRVALPLVLLAGASVAALAGCGADEEKGARTATATATTETTATSARPTGAGETELTATSTTQSPGIDSTGTSNAAATLSRPFAPNSPWNTLVSSAEVDAQSNALLREARLRVGAVDEGSGTGTKDVVLNDPLFINTRKWTVPVVDEVGGVDTPVYCRQPPLPPLPESRQSIPDERALCGDGWAVDSLLIPPGESPHPAFDGWFTVLNRQQGVAYDLWRARRSQDGRSLSYQFMRIWDLNGSGFLAPNRVSARGSGLPFLGGLITPDEIAAGRIDHALAISVPAPSQGNYVQPASSTDGVGRITSLPEGARLRLKPSVTLKSIQRRYTDLRCANILYGTRDGTRKTKCRKFRFQGSNQKAAAALMRALRQYGAIVVDRSSVPTLYAQFNVDWTRAVRSDTGQLLDARGNPFPRGTRRFSTPRLRGNELQGIRLTDFEVVQSGDRLPFPRLGRIEVAPLAGGATGQEPEAPPPSITTSTTSTTSTTTTGGQPIQPAGGTGGG